MSANTDMKIKEKVKEAEESRFRSLKGPMAILVKILGAGGALFCFFQISNLFSIMGILFLAAQYNAIFLAIIMSITYLVVPASKTAPRDRVPWYDWTLMACGIAGCAYIIANALELAYFEKIAANPLEFILGYMTLIALVEAVRRSFGYSMVVIVILFLLYTKFGYLIPGIMNTHYFSWSDLVADFYLSGSGIFGHLLGIASGIIMAFVSFGVFYVAVGGGDFFMKIALAGTGHMKGGPAKAAIVGSAMFGTLSGSPEANTVVTGSITIPLMKKTGYEPFYAGAIEAIAATGGGITPPIMAGVAFVMAQMIGVPYAAVATAAIIPAFLYFQSLYYQVHMHACKSNIAGLPKAELPSFMQSLKEGWFYILPFSLLVYTLFIWRLPPETSAVWSILSIIALSYVIKEFRFKIKWIINSLEDGLRALVGVGNLLALAGIILAMLTVTGLGPKLSSALVTAAGGSKVAMVVMAALASYILGMGISWIAAYILVSVLVAPALQQMGVPLMASHFFIMFMVLSGGFTPPYCTTAYVAGAIAGAHPFKVGFVAMRLGMVAFLVPLIIVFNPALIMIGSTADIILAVITASIGIFGMSAGMEGWVFGRASAVQRIFFLAGGLMMVIPERMTDIAGLIILAAMLIWQWQTREGQKKQTQAAG